MTETIDTNVQTGSYETYLNRAGEGNDEAVLFLQGSGPGATAWSNWQFALPALGERFDCLAPDLIGYGKSDHPDAVGGDLEGIAEQRYPAAMDENVSSSFASMFPEPRQKHVDDLTLPDLAFQRMDHPVLLIHGRDDGIIPLETSLYLLERLPNVQMHVFGQCRHWIMIEYAAAFNELLSDFLKGDGQ